MLARCALEWRERIWNVDYDVAVLYAALKGGDSVQAGAVFDVARFQAEACGMPRARHSLAAEDAVGQRRAIVRALGSDSVHFGRSRAR